MENRKRMDKDKEAICINKYLYSVGDIIQDNQYANLYFEIHYSEYGGCMCYLWNDLGVFAFRVGFVPGSYTLNSFFRMIKIYPLAILKAKLQEDSANGNG